MWKKMLKENFNMEIYALIKDKWWKGERKNWARLNHTHATERELNDEMMNDERREKELSEIDRQICYRPAVMKEGKTIMVKWEDRTIIASVQQDKGVCMKQKLL